MKATRYFFIAALLWIQHSCSRPDEAATALLPATVLYSGGYEADGCGFEIRMDADGSFHKPADLPATYHRDGLAIWVRFVEDSTRIACGDLPPGRPAIRILEIRERDTSRR